jgi:hypothetical protein
VSGPDPGTPHFSAGDADPLGDLDDDVIAVVRAGLREMEPAVGSRVDHHRFWRDGQKQRQRRNALVTSSAVLTLLAVLIPLVIVSLPRRGGSSAQVRMEASPPVPASTLPTLLSGESLLATIGHVDPQVSGLVVNTPATAGTFLGRAMLHSAAVGGRVGTGAAAVPLIINAYRLSSPPAPAAVTGYLIGQLARPGIHVSTAAAGGGSYWLQDTGWDGVAVAVTGSGLVLTVDCPAQSPAAGRALVVPLVKALAASAM